MKLLETPLDEKIIGAVAFVAVTTIGWVSKVTAKVWRHDVAITRVETKLDMLLNHFGIDVSKKE